MSLNPKQPVYLKLKDGYLIGWINEIVGEYAIVAYDQLQDLQLRPSDLRRTEIRETLLSTLKQAEYVEQSNQYNILTSNRFQF